MVVIERSADVIPCGMPLTVGVSQTKIKYEIKQTSDQDKINALAIYYFAIISRIYACLKKEC